MKRLCVYSENHRSEDIYKALDLAGEIKEKIRNKILKENPLSFQEIKQISAPPRKVMKSMEFHDYDDKAKSDYENKMNDQKEEDDK